MIKFKRIDFDVSPFIENLPEVFVKHNEIIAAYLFGSYASGKVKPLSDIDIGYIIEKGLFDKNYINKELTIEAEISRLLKTDEVDCVLLNKAHISFQYKVISQGKIIYCKDEAKRASYEAYIISRYLDLKYYIDLNSKIFLENIAKIHDKS